MTRTHSSATLVASAALLWGPPAFAEVAASPTLPFQHATIQSARDAQKACPKWAECEFEKLASLRDSWHEFDADPIQPKTISQLRAIMAAARNAGEHTGFIVPGADGSLQAEWHLDNVIIGALVDDDGTASAWARFVDDDAEVEEYGLNSVDFLRSLAVAYRLDV